MKIKNLLLLLTIGLVVTAYNQSAQAQATLNKSISIGKSWGTNAVTTTASGNTGVAAFGTNIFDGPALVTSIAIGNQTGVPINVAFFDAPNAPFRALYTSDVYTTTNSTLTPGAIFYVHAANGAGYGLATWTQALGNVTKIVTNFTGIKTTNTFTNALLSGWWTNNMATNNFRLAYSVTVPANTTLIPNLGSGIYIGSGLTVTNGVASTFDNAASNVTISVNYDPSL